jgi:inhibitor of cysteine peptidase
MSKSQALGWIAIGLLFGACGPRLSAPAPGVTVTPGEDVVYGEALVEDVSIVFLESFPLQVRAAVSGYLPNPCSWVDQVTVDRVGQQFNVSILRGSNAGEICIQVEEAFEESIPLDVYGLPAGDYTIDVNGVRATFTFTQDNILKEVE